MVLLLLLAVLLLAVLLPCLPISAQGNATDRFNGQEAACGWLFPLPALVQVNPDAGVRPPLPPLLVLLLSSAADLLISSRVASDGVLSLGPLLLPALLLLLLSCSC